LIPSSIPSGWSVAGASDIATQCILPLKITQHRQAQRAGPNAPRAPGYDIGPIIGSGGMGVVYQARHRDLNRTVALKMLRGEALADREFRDRFRCEAEAMARLQHPHIIQVFEIGSAEAAAEGVCASPFIALEFVEGGSLARQTATPQPARGAAEVVEKLARAAHFAHQLGVVHRDLKPANVLMTGAGEPKIADFGLAKQLETQRDTAGRFATQAGTIMGTPEYMAPEQAAEAAPTPAVDIYALGVILYELLTARVPFQGATPIETITLAAQQDPVSPRRLQPGLSRDLETICLKCLEKDPGRRYSSALALADDLRRFLDGRSILARRASGMEQLTRWCRRNPPVAASLAGIAATVLIAFLLVSRSYWQVEKALHQEEAHRHEAERKEKAERWERYRANITAAGNSLDVFDASGVRRNLVSSPEEHRNWEWRHFRSRTDLAKLVLSSDGAFFGGWLISGDGNRVVLLGDDNVVRLINAVSGKTVRVLRASSKIRETLVTPNGGLLVHFRDDESFDLWDAASDRIQVVRHGHGARPSTRAVSADGTRILTAGADLTVRVWETASGRSVSAFRPFAAAFRDVQISPNGRRVFVVNSDTREAGVWNADTGILISRLSTGGDDVVGGNFNRKGTQLVTMTRYPNCDMKLWDVETGRLLGVMSGHENAVLSRSFSPDDTRVATCSMDQTIRLWDGHTGEFIAALRGHKGWVNDVAFSPDGKRLVSASQDYTLRVWDGRTGAPRTVLPGHAAEVTRVAYTPDGNGIVSLSNNGVVRLWDTQMVERDGVLRGHTQFVYNVAYHPDGARVVSGSWDGTARVWDIKSGRQLLTVDHGKNSIVVAVGIHPNGKTFASRTRDALHLWDLESGREIHCWNTPSDSWRHTRIAFSSDGALLASGGVDGKIHVWDFESRAEIAVLEGHTDVVRDVAFSPDGQWLASAGESSDKTIRIWSVAEKRQVHVLKAHRDCVYCLGFNKDGSILASGSKDGTVRLWDTANWTETAILKHGTNVYSVAFTPDGSRLACACANNSIRLWDVSKAQEIVDLRGHDAYVHAIAFSPDGGKLVSASGDFTLRVWSTKRPLVSATKR